MNRESQPPDHPQRAETRAPHSRTDMLKEQHGGAIKLLKSLTIDPDIRMGLFIAYLAQSGKGLKEIAGDIGVPEKSIKTQLKRVSTQNPVQIFEFFQAVEKEQTEIYQGRATKPVLRSERISARAALEAQDAAVLYQLRQNPEFSTISLSKALGIPEVHAQDFIDRLKAERKIGPAEIEIRNRHQEAISALLSIGIPQPHQEALFYDYLVRHGMHVKSISAGMGIPENHVQFQLETVKRELPVKRWKFLKAKEATKRESKRVSASENSQAATVIEAKPNQQRTYSSATLLARRQAIKFLKEQNPDITKKEISEEMDNLSLSIIAKDLNTLIANHEITPYLRRYNPTAVAARNEFRAQVKQMYEDESSYPEIASKTGRPIGTVISTLSDLIQTGQVTSRRAKQQDSQTTYTEHPKKTT